MPFLELPEDWEQFGPFMQAALSLMPRLAETGIQHFMNGPESFTADTRPLVGETSEIGGLYVAAGMNSVGVMSSAGIGRLLADWVMDGHPSTDAWEVDVARVDPHGSEPSPPSRPDERGRRRSLCDALAVQAAKRQAEACADRLSTTSGPGPVRRSG